MHIKFFKNILNLIKDIFIKREYSLLYNNLLKKSNVIDFIHQLLHNSYLHHMPYTLFCRLLLCGDCL